MRIEDSEIFFLFRSHGIPSHSIHRHRTASLPSIPGTVVEPITPHGLSIIALSISIVSHSRVTFTHPGPSNKRNKFCFPSFGPNPNPYAAEKTEKKQKAKRGGKMNVGCLTNFAWNVVKLNNIVERLKPYDVVSIGGCNVMTYGTVVVTPKAPAAGIMEDKKVSCLIMLVVKGTPDDHVSMNSEVRP